MPVGAECEMIGGHRRLQRRENVDLPRAADLENRAAAIADVQVFLGIERQARRHAHAFHINRGIAVRGDLINNSVVAAGDV